MEYPEDFKKAQCYKKEAEMPAYALYLASDEFYCKYKNSVSKYMDEKEASSVHYLCLVALFVSVCVPI